MAQIEFEIYKDFSTRLAYAKHDVEALKREISSTVTERGSKTNVSTLRPGLRSGDGGCHGGAKGGRSDIQPRADCRRICKNNVQSHTREQVHWQEPVMSLLTG